MVLEKRPESMIIIGSGAIGTEFAYIYNSFGTRVTLIEALPRMLPNEDDDSCMTLERAFKKQGIKVMTELPWNPLRKPVTDRSGPA